MSGQDSADVDVGCLVCDGVCTEQYRRVGDLTPTVADTLTDVCGGDLLAPTDLLCADCSHLLAALLDWEANALQLRSKLTESYTQARDVRVQRLSLTQHISNDERQLEAACASLSSSAPSSSTSPVMLAVDSLVSAAPSADYFAVGPVSEVQLAVAPTASPLDRELLEVSRKPSVILPSLGPSSTGDGSIKGLVPLQSGSRTGSTSRAVTASASLWCRVDGAKPFKCLSCGRLFAHRKSVGVHVRTHTGERPYSCAECGGQFALRSTLVQHQRTHLSDKPFVCAQCGRAFAARSYLNHHQRVHTQVKAACCDVCGKTFRDAHYLLIHQRVHSGEKPFVCAECGRCYTTLSNLYKHQRRHASTPSLCCEICGRTFQEPGDLRDHRRSHTGEKPHACPQCGRRFTLAKVLARHMRLHSGEMPHGCDSCGRRFARRETLQRHQLRFHADPQLTPAADIDGHLPSQPPAYQLPADDMDLQMPADELSMTYGQLSDMLQLTEQLPSSDPAPYLEVVFESAVDDSSAELQALPPYERIVQ